MANIRKRKVGEEAYYYLEHSVRKGRKVEKKELYLGKEIPKNIEEIKKKFLFDAYGKEMLAKFDEIRKNYAKEQERMPISAKEEENKNFMIRFTYDTNKIEGSKITLRETANILEKHIPPGGKPLRDIKETEAHAKVFYEMLAHKKEITYNLVLSWHRLLLGETKPDIAGKIREYQIAISGSRFMPPPPVEVYPLMKELFGWYERSREKMHPVELAGLIHLKLVTVHPFGDGNGRIGRLAMNFVLNKHGFPMLNIPYEKRGGYYKALERAQTKKDNQIFLNWFFKRYLKEHQRFLKK